MVDAIQLNFGKFGNTDRFIKISNVFQNTLVFLFSSLAFSFLLSGALLFLRQFRIIEKTVIKYALLNTR